MASRVVLFSSDPRSSRALRESTSADEYGRRQAGTGGFPLAPFRWDVAEARMRGVAVLRPRGQSWHRGMIAGASLPVRTVAIC